MEKNIYTAILFSVLSAAVMAQNGNSNKETWLYDHSHKYFKSASEEQAKESDSYYTYNDEGILRLTHEVSVNSKKQYEHTYTWWMMVFDEMWPARYLTATNSYEDYFMAGVTYETRLESNRTSENYTITEKRFKDGNQSPYQKSIKEYNYNGLGQAISYRNIIQNLGTNGEVTEEWTETEKTFEYDDQRRISGYKTSRLYYYSKDSELNTLATETYSDFNYGSAALAEAPQNVASDEWETWLRKNSSDKVSYTVTETIDNGADGTIDSKRTFTETNTHTTEGGAKEYKRTKDVREDGNVYVVYEMNITDQLGSYTEHLRTYSLNAGEEPTDEKITNGYMRTRTCTTEYDYEEDTKEYTGGKLDENPSQKSSQKGELHPEYGFLTRLSYDSTVYNDNEEYTSNTVITYDTYHRPGEAAAISTVNADTCAPTFIYNTQGVCLGSQLNTLPQGLYIVKQGGKTTKVRK